MSFIKYKRTMSTAQRAAVGYCTAAECFGALTRCQAFVMDSTAANAILLLHIVKPNSL